MAQMIEKIINESVKVSVGTAFEIFKKSFHQKLDPKVTNTVQIFWALVIS